MLIKRFENLETSQISRLFIKRIYSITNAGKFAKDFGLKDQLQRASTSILLNIAEGFDSGSQKSFINFFAIHIDQPLR